MRKMISICFLWAFSLALWGQSNGGYGGDYNPTNPDNPQEPSTIIKYDLSVTAGRGGSVYISPSESQFVAGANIYLSASPNSGYKFRYWMKDGKVISTSSWFYYTMPAEDVEIQAYFEFNPNSPANPDVTPLTYRVTVEASPSRGGNVYRGSERVAVGTYTYVSASPYSGYRFKGWMLDGELVSNDSYYYFEMEARNMHFTALFEFNPSSPSNPNNNPNGEVTYQLMYTIDGEVCYTEELPEGAAITTIAEPTKRGYTFGGWEDVPTVMPANNLVISGTFIVNQYNVVYKVEGDTIHTQDIDYGTTLVPPVGEEREGYTLVWDNMPSEMPDFNLVVEGYYAINTYTLTFVVDNEVYRTIDVLYTDSIDLIEAPYMEGYTFSGWSEIPATMPACDVVVTGNFTVNTYLVVFKVDGEVIASDSLEYGTVIDTPEVAEREGYTFCGWQGVDVLVPAHDVTYEGYYDINTYSVFYYVGENLVHIEEVVYGEDIPEYIYDSIVEGETFLGWAGEIYDTMPAHDVVYVADIDTSIDSSLIGEQASVVYDLLGRKVRDDKKLKCGIYIVNGRKVLIK